MTPPTSPLRPESPIYEWPPAPAIARQYCNARLRDPLPLKPIVVRVREALEKCGIVNEHAVQAVLEIIEANN